MPLNFNAKMEEDIKEVLMSAEELQKTCARLGAEISQDYEGKQPILVCVLNGATVFFADLARCITIPCEIDSICMSSYGKKSSSGDVAFKKDVSIDVKGRHVIFIEDIIDTGKTLKAVGEIFADRGAESIVCCALLDKQARREVQGLNDKYIGHSCPDEFVVGYGIDYAERYRNLPYVAALKPCVYE